MRIAGPRWVTIIPIGVAILTAPTFAQSNSDKIVLITEKEAALPVALVTDMTFRAGITRGPQVVLVSPPGNDSSALSPVHVQFRFEAHGGAKIDPNSIKITYLKVPPVDLTERVKSFMGPNGIDVPAAEIPAGKHPIRVEVKDSDGRSGSANFTLKISP
jgi:hypothetical protein